MELIDKKGKINKTTFKQIVDKAGDNHIGINVNAMNSGLECNTTADTLLIDLFCLNIPDEKNCTVTIDIEIDDVAWVCTGKDINWFLKDDRLADLSKYVYGKDVFNISDDATEPVTPAKIRTIKPNKLLDMNTYNVAIASTSDPENPEVETFSGYKVDCVKWLNQQIVKHANLQNEVNILICLDFSVDEPEWHTLKELFDAGKIDIC